MTAHSKLEFTREYQKRIPFLQHLRIVTDDLGQAHFSYVPDEHMTIETGEGTRLPILEGNTLKPGDDYVIRAEEGDPIEESEPFTVRVPAFTAVSTE